jgi:hypothetical protein
MATPQTPQSGNSGDPDADEVKELRAQVSSMSTLIINLTEQVSQLSTASTQSAAADRQSLIRNSRASLQGIPFTSPLAVSPATAATTTVLSPTSTFHRRLTGAETLASPLPLPPTTSTLDQTDAKDSSDPTEETSPRTPHDEGWLTNEKGHNLLMKKVEAPVTITGTGNDKVGDVRDWVDKVDEYLDLMLGEGVEGGRLRVVGMYMDGPARRWLKDKKGELHTLHQLGRLPRPAEWKEIQHEFVEWLEGPSFRLERRLDMDRLRLGKGDPKTHFQTVHALNLKFDEIAARLYKSGTDLKTAQMEEVIADDYSRVIQRSDLSLWKDTYHRYMPQTLTEWKMYTLRTWSAQQSVKHMEATLAHSSPVTMRSAGTVIHERAPVAVQRMAVAHSPEDQKETWQRVEGSRK